MSTIRPEHNRLSPNIDRSRDWPFKIGNTWVPMTRCIVNKERCVEHAIECGGNGARLKVGPGLEPILNEVMVARKRKG